MQKKILFVLMPDNYRDEEFVVPYNDCVAAGHIVDVAGFSKDPAVGSRGHEQRPDLLIDGLTNSDMKEYHALVIPGGYGSCDYLWDNPRVTEICQFFAEHKKLIACICYACVVPAQAGILKEKPATVCPTDEPRSKFESFGAQFVDQGCHYNEELNLITAQGPQNSKEFAQAILVNV